MKSIARYQLDKIENDFGEAFYILDTDVFEKNYHDLLDAMRKYYEKTVISYSYKTNYIPRLCALVNELGGYAEVVSDMERALALRIGVPHEKIVFNGPYKRNAIVEEAVLSGELVNVDSFCDLQVVTNLAKNNPNKELSIGIRCNFGVGDGVCSRFGFDCESEEFEHMLNEVVSIPNLNIQGLHCHIASRNLMIWKNKVESMLELIERLQFTELKYVSMGGGLYGRMEDSLKRQFDAEIPDFDDYAKVIAKAFAKYYKEYNETKKPILFLEPGSALAGDAMRFVAKVINIKNIRGKSIATLLGSVYNINPTLNGKNSPIEVVSKKGAHSRYYDNLDFGGYTCIESDYLYRGYSGNLAVGDYVIFGNVGSYSVVLKPPFILPNFPIVELDGDKIKVIKYAEQMEDIFVTYEFS